GAHVLDFGFQEERYELRYLTSGIAGNYLADAPGALVSNVQGETQLQSLYAQDVWRFATDWTAVIGGRAGEHARRPVLADELRSERQPEHQPRSEHRTHCNERDRSGDELEGLAGERPRAVGQPHLRRLEDQGERRLRGDARRHDRQVAAQRPTLARERAGQLSI